VKDSRKNTESRGNDAGKKTKHRRFLADCSQSSTAGMLRGA
jgi:hypothetical protein